MGAVASSIGSIGWVDSALWTHEAAQNAQESATTTTVPR
jgi:hypothetical protein